jgi:transposase
MGWKESTIKDEKLKFITRYLEDETITDLCKEFGVSRTTGHNLIKRYRQMGSEALVAQSRAPKRYANKLPIQVEALILDLKRQYKNWGAPKIREKIIKAFLDVKAPTKSTVHAGIKNKYPSEIYVTSKRIYTKPESIYYPLHDQTITVTQCGRVCMKGMKVSLSTKS